MKKASLILSALVAATFSTGAALAQGTGAGSSGSAGGGTGTGDGAVPGGRSAAQGGTVAPAAGSYGGSSSSTPAGSTGPSGAGAYGGSSMPSGTVSGSGTAAASGTASDAPLSRAEVQRDAIDAAHGGRLPRGDALVTNRRPHGGPINGDAPLAPAPLPTNHGNGFADQAD